MVRGTFANIRLVNKFLDKVGPRTLYLPTGETMSIFEASERYRQDGVPLIVLAGKDYGCGSSRGERNLIYSFVSKLLESNLKSKSNQKLIFSILSQIGRLRVHFCSASKRFWPKASSASIVAT